MTTQSALQSNAVNGYRINRRPKYDTSDEEFYGQDYNTASKHKSNQGIITLCIGQSGSFTGTAFLRTIMKEHKLNLNGAFTGNTDFDSNNKDLALLSKIDTHFHLQSTNDTYNPNFIFIDNDISTSNKIKFSTIKSLLNNDNFIHGDYSAPSIIYPKGYKLGSDIIEQVMDKIRKKIESYDYYQGSNIIHSSAGGFGSGFTSLLLTKLQDEYPMKQRFVTTLWPDISRGTDFGNHAFAVYNNVLCMNNLIDNAHSSFLVHQLSLLRRAVMQCKLKYPTYDDMNWISSLILSGITSPLRFNVEPDLCSNLRRYYHHFVLFPRLKFFVLAHAPFWDKNASAENFNFMNDDRKIYDGIFNNDMSGVSFEDGKIFTNATFWRSENQRCIDKMIKVFKHKHTDNWENYYQDYCFTWMKYSCQSGYIYDGGIHCYKDITPVMGTTVYNSTAIKAPFQRLSAHFAKLFKRRAWLSYYENEGIEQDEMLIADKNIRDLIVTYQDKQDDYVEYHRPVSMSETDDYDDDDDGTFEEDDDEEEEDF